MWFLLRRVPRRHLSPLRYNRYNVQPLKQCISSSAATAPSTASGAGIITNASAAVSPLFAQTPPAWARYAWPIVIANGLILGSAIELTWNHWATLVRDLEEIGEKNRASVGSSSSSEEETSKVTYHWEQRPVWQRAAFCGLYALGWALSTAYLLKYRQTFATKLRFFRVPVSSPATPISSSTSPSISPGPPKQTFERMIHISTVSKPKGVTLPLRELTIQDGRNETELVILYKDISSLPKSGKSVRRGRKGYWLISLTDARVQGAKMGDIVRARDEIIWAFDGVKRKGGVILGQSGIEEGESRREKAGSKVNTKGKWRRGSIMNR